MSGLDVGYFPPQQLVGGLGDDGVHALNRTTEPFSASKSVASLTIALWEGLLRGGPLVKCRVWILPSRRSWQNFLDAALRLYGTLNRGLVDKHKLTLVDVRLLEILDNSETGSARMGDLAEQLMSLPSRVTRQIRRLETAGLVRREASPDDGRGVLGQHHRPRPRGRRGSDADVRRGRAGELPGAAVAAADGRDGRELPTDQRLVEGRRHRRRSSAASNRTQLGAPRRVWSYGHARTVVWRRCNPTLEGSAPATCTATLVGGGVAERPNALALKARVRLTPSGGSNPSATGLSSLLWAAAAEFLWISLGQMRHAAGRRTTELRASNDCSGHSACGWSELPDVAQNVSERRWATCELAGKAERTLSFA